MQQHVTIRVDGEDVVLEGGQHVTEYVVQAAGLAPTRYDLFRIDPDGMHVVTHYVGDTVVLTDGDYFITAAVSTTTA